LEKLMPTTRHLGLLVCSILLFTACQQPEEASAAASEGASGAKYEGDVAKASYGLGYGLGQRLRQQFGENIDLDMLLQGIRHASSGSEALVARDDSTASLERITTQMQEESAAANTVTGKAFMAENATREDVISLPSGLQYEVITMGDGEKPGPTDRVTTHYKGTLINGEVFDSSVARGQPATFLLNGVIAGWTEALQLMPVGSKWRLFIPPDLAYGDRNMGSITPGSTLIFEVELLEIGN
tara:strand:+ start:1463 stop:2185 length:723 start_codon:yes stop_codon:yes gene_type:complete